MPFTDEQYRTIKCDGPGCPKEVRFDLKDVKAIKAIDWLKGVRVVQTGDNRALSYCSDVCEVKAVTTDMKSVVVTRLLESTTITSYCFVELNINPPPGTFTMKPFPG